MFCSRSAFRISARCDLPLGSCTSPGASGGPPPACANAIQATAANASDAKQRMIETLISATYRFMIRRCPNLAPPLGDGYHGRNMEEVNVGIIGLGNVGSATLRILAENADQIAGKLGFRLNVVAVCSRSVASKQLPAAFSGVVRTTDWREVVSRPDVHIVAEL